MSKEPDIASICARLAVLQAERSELNEQLERLEAQRRQEEVRGRGDSLITAKSTAAEKITLSRRLFAGRPDVFSGAMGKSKYGEIRLCACLRE